MDITTLETSNLGDLAQALMLSFFSLGVGAYVLSKWVFR